MPLALSSPITGSAVSGLTSPTYTIATDVAPNSNSLQYAVTALGGTQTGATANTVSSPFTITFTRQYPLRGIAKVGSNGYLVNNPNNQYKMITRKGVIPLAGQASVPASIQTVFTIPAGADANNPVEIKAMVSAHLGALAQDIDDLVAMLLTGVM